MSKIIGYFSTLLIVIGVITWTLIAILGGMEILWWIFTGDFFHFVSTSVEAAGTVW